MKRFYFLVFTFLVFFAGGVKAQNVTHGGVVVHTDPRLGLLLKKNKAVVSAAKVPKAPKTPADANAPKTTGTEKVTRTPVPVEYVTSRRGGTISSGKGFRVQIYNGPDRAKAIDVKTTFMHNNPGVRTYLTYISPCFRVKVGNYRNRSDAEGMLREAKSAYTPCMIVPDIITISTF